MGLFNSRDGELGRSLASCASDHLAAGAWVSNSPPRCGNNAQGSGQWYGSFQIRASQPARETQRARSGGSSTWPPHLRTGTRQDSRGSPSSALPQLLWDPGPLAGVQWAGWVDPIMSHRIKLDLSLSPPPQTTD